MANEAQNAVFEGLGTFTYKTQAAGHFFFEGKSQMPRLSQGNGPSALVVVCNLNGVPFYTGDAGADGFRAESDCDALDTITIVFSSANAIDAQNNVIKTAISIYTGE